MAASPKTPISDLISKLIAQYGCGPIKFSGTDEALYERHLLFDNVVDANDLTLRERYEAVARSVRDVLSQQWIRTEQTYERENPKRIYYLSIEFLLGRSLANNITNLMLDPIAAQLIKEKNVDWLGLLEQEPDPGLGNGGLGRLAACFLIRWRRCNFRRQVTDCVTNTGCSSSPSRMAGKKSGRTIGCAAPILGRSCGLRKALRLR